MINLASRNHMLVFNPQTNGYLCRRIGTSVSSSNGVPTEIIILNCSGTEEVKETLCNLLFCLSKEQDELSKEIKKVVLRHHGINDEEKFRQLERKIGRNVSNQIYVETIVELLEDSSSIVEPDVLLLDLVSNKINKWVSPFDTILLRENYLI